MKSVTDTIERRLDAIVEWANRRITNGMLNAMYASFQTVKRNARGLISTRTMKVVCFKPAEKLGFYKVKNQFLPISFLIDSVHRF